MDWNIIWTIVWLVFILLLCFIFHSAWFLMLLIIWLLGWAF